MAEKRYLMTPGPTPVPPEVLAAMAQPIIHHRGPDFRAIYKRTLERLQEVFRTESEVLLFAASGTGAMESTVANLCSAGDRVLVVSAGYFGQRWAAMTSPALLPSRLEITRPMLITRTRVAPIVEEAKFQSSPGQAIVVVNPPPPPPVLVINQPATEIPVDRPVPGDHGVLLVRR